MGPSIRALLQLSQCLLQVHQKAPYLSSHFKRHEDGLWLHQRHLGRGLQNTLSRSCAATPLWPREISSSRTIAFPKNWDINSQKSQSGFALRRVHGSRANKSPAHADSFISYEH